MEQSEIITLITMGAQLANLANEWRGSSQAEKAILDLLVLAGQLAHKVAAAEFRVIVDPPIGGRQGL